MATNKNIKVIELRNYLIKQNEADSFNSYFSNHFNEPMQEMGISVLGKFKIKNNNDRFVWVRGYKDMQQRNNFLNDFYLKSEVWKKYKKVANDLIRNSDNVYLLRPINIGDKIEDTITGFSSSVFDNNNPFVAVDFYIANTRLNELIEFYNKDYLPVLKSLNIETTMWVSETAKNDFPQLPVFQDKNLLITITFYKNENEYKLKARQIKLKINDELKTKMQDIITTHNELLLHKF